MKEHNGHNYVTVDNMTTNHHSKLEDVTAPVDEITRDLSAAQLGQMLTPQGSPYSVVVQQSIDYTRVGKPSKIVNNDGNMGQPWGVAFGKNGMWAVADITKHCVYIFDGQDQLVKKIGGEINVNINGQFCKPEGVAFDSNNTLYVAEHDSHRVQVFDAAGNFLCLFGSRGSGNGQLCCPVGITIHDKNVFITEDVNKRISVFHTNGQFSHIIGKGQLGRPYDVTVNTNNQLLVVDSAGHCIHAFKLNGEYIGNFATPGSGNFATPGSGGGQFNDPHGLTTDLHGFVLVADSSYHRVSIFDKAGNFIRCFGCYGNEDGKFIYSYGIAVSPNGDIYVSDHINKRVQIFSTY